MSEMLRDGGKLKALPTGGEIFIMEFPFGLEALI